MGLKEIKAIRQYTDFDVDGKMFRAYEVKFTTERTEGEFSVDIRTEEYTPEKARELASQRADEIDELIG